MDKEPAQNSAGYNASSQNGKPLSDRSSQEERQAEQPRKKKTAGTSSGPRTEKAAMHKAALSSS